MHSLDFYIATSLPSSHSRNSIVQTMKFSEYNEHCYNTEEIEPHNRDRNISPILIGAANTNVGMDRKVLNRMGFWITGKVSKKTR